MEKITALEGATTIEKKRLRLKIKFSFHKLPKFLFRLPLHTTKRLISHVTKTEFVCSLGIGV